MRKILCIVISMFILMSISNAGLAIGINADSEITGPIEEKVFSNATMDDDFADDQIIVIITNSASLKFKEYTVADFSEIPCSGVRDLMPTATAKAEVKEIILEEADKLSNLTQYCQDGNRLNAYAAVAACHTHCFAYSKTATTHTGTCPCGATTGTMFHSWGTNLDGTRVCTICGYYRESQIASTFDSETE